MFTFTFVYLDGTARVFEDINKVVYNSGSEEVTITEDEILSSRFPIDRTLYLYSEDSNITITDKNLVFINVFKQPN